MSRVRRKSRERPSWLRRLVAGRPVNPEAARAREVERRLAALRGAQRHPDLPSDHRAFLQLALGRLEAIRSALPDPVRGQAITLNWQEALLDALERQAAGWPRSLRPWPTTLPTTRAEEDERRQAREALATHGRRVRGEREEILGMLNEIEKGLEGYFDPAQASPTPSPSASA